MLHGANKYPVSLLLERLVADHGPTPSDFVSKLGCRNIERGIRRLEPWITTGEGSHRIIDQIAVTYPMVATELKLAIRATAAIKRIERQNEWLERCKSDKEVFRPFLNCDGQTTIPNGTVLFGLTGGHGRWTRIEIPLNVLDLPVEEQLSALPLLMREYAVRFGGQVPFFGKLRGFKFVRLSDYFVFDWNGVLIGQVLEPFRPGTVEVWLE